MILFPWKNLEFLILFFFNAHKKIQANSKCSCAGSFRVRLVIDLGCLKDFGAGWDFGDFYDKQAYIRLQSLVGICLQKWHYDVIMTKQLASLLWLPHLWSKIILGKALFFLQTPAERKVPIQNISCVWTNVNGDVSARSWVICIRTVWNCQLGANSRIQQGQRFLVSPFLCMSFINLWCYRKGVYS